MIKTAISVGLTFRLTERLKKLKASDRIIEMTNISKKVLSSKQIDVLSDQFYSLLSNRSAGKVERVLSSLLGKEEWQMLVKRFAVIILLKQKCTQYQIAKTLNVSTSTTSRIEGLYKRGKYDDFFKVLDNKGVSIVEILNGIDSALHLGGILPQYGMTHKMEEYKKTQAAKRIKK